MNMYLLDWLRELDEPPRKGVPADVESGWIFAVFGSSKSSDGISAAALALQRPAEGHDERTGVVELEVLLKIGVA
jgi:hypothetical protein